ncbi:MAG TPA: GNAT family N-acetyltransferase [Dermatophilaceae bacterium]|jgi:GNAT superfamily N-acetyltransferase
MDQGERRASPTAQDVVVIRVTGEDWRELRAVRLAALAEAPAAFGSNLRREQDFGEDQWRDWSRSAGLFIARVGGTPVGMAAGVSGDSNVECKLVGMWVDPGWRGRDVASGLVGSVIDWARSEGSERVRLWVADGNESARRLYERLGFVVTGDRKPVPGPAQYRGEMALELC